MKLLAAAAALVAVSIAQPASAVTIDLDWEVDIGTSNDASISVGDTVRWTWTDTNTHNVRATAGPETYDSDFLTGSGTTFSHTFTQVGDSDYQCDVHGSASMSGTITVPEPSSVVQLMSGILGLIALNLRRRRRLARR